MKSKHISAVQLIRHLIQLAAFALFPGLFLTVLSALRDIVTALLNSSFSLSALSAQILTVLAVFVVTALWGRFFCGYLCAFGALQELISFAFGKLPLRKRHVPASLDRALKYCKYAVLLFWVIGVWILQLPIDSTLSPWGVFGLLVSGNAASISTAIPSVGFALLLAVLVGSIFVNRFFCRYLCPLGALFTVVSPKRLFRIRRRPAPCTDCRLCTKACSMGLSVHAADAVTSGECVNCMECLSACHFGSLHTDPSPAIAGTAASLAMCGLITVGNLTVNTAPSASSSVSQQTASGAYENGVFTGSGNGFRGSTEVEVTVENGSISEITVLSYEDDPEFFNKAQASVLQAILSAQTPAVDAVSGATYSSNSIMEAVANALGCSDLVQGSFQETPSESAAQSSADAEAGSQAEANSSETAAASQSTGTLDLSSVADGTYQGSGTGFRGTTTVFVTVESGVITDITVASYQDDQQFFTKAESTMIGEVLAAQSLAVDTVSGATYASSSILEAVANALGVSYESPLPSAPQAGAAGGGHGGRR